MGGLDYMHARYYSSNYKRFLSPDPVGGDPASPQSWNRYAYVLNNPVLYVDPFGLSECQKTGPGEWTCTDHAVGEDGASSNEYDPYEEWMFWIRMGQDRFGPLEITIDGPVSLQNQASIYRQMLFDEVFSGEAELLPLDLGFTMEEIGAIFGSQSQGTPLDLVLGFGAAGLVGGAARTAAFNAQQRALIALAKEASRKGVTRSEAATLLRWAREYGIPATGHSRTTHWIGGSHIGIWTYRHVPVR